jgi:hypothetical protein
VRQACWALKYALGYIVFVGTIAYLTGNIVLGVWKDLGTVTPKALKPTIEWLTALFGRAGQEAESTVRETEPLAVWIAAFAVVASLGRMAISQAFVEKMGDDARSAFALVDCQNPHSELRRNLVARVRSAVDATGVGGKERISILAYSHGALLAIDALFPTFPTQQTNAGQSGAQMCKIRLFVTFGCPLAIVKCLWPSRRKGVITSEPNIEKWINVYESTDQLGGRVAGLIDGIRTPVCDREFTWQAAGERWISPHMSYWRAAEETNECACLSAIVDTITARRQAGRT